MRAPEYFEIIIRGSVRRVLDLHWVHADGLPYLLERLVTGKIVAEEAFAAYGLTVTIEPCTDQRDDGVDEAS